MSVPHVRAVDYTLCDVTSRLIDWRWICVMGGPPLRALAILCPAHPAFPSTPGVLATPLCRDVNTVMRPKCTTEVCIATCRRRRQCHKYVRLLVTDDEKQKSLSVPQQQMQFFLHLYLLFCYRSSDIPGTTKSTPPPAISC